MGSGKIKTIARNMFIDTKNICDCQNRNKHRLKFFVSVLFFLSLLPVVMAKTIIEYNNSNYEYAVLRVPKIENAKEYIIQIDDSMNYMSPDIEKKIPANREKAIFRLLKKHKPYHWRYQVKLMNGEIGDWNNQLEVPKYTPSEDKLFMMEGDRFKISDRIFFYFYIRNDGDLPETYEYDASIRTDVVADNVRQSEARGVVYGKVDLTPKSYKLIRAEMKVGDFLEVNKEYHTVARIDGYEATKNFYIEPSYKGDISTKEIETGTGEKVKLYITNTSDEEIKSLKANMSTSYNLVVDEWWQMREVSYLAPGATEYFEWNMKVSEPGKSEVDIDILSDGGTQRLQKTFMSYMGALIVDDYPELYISANEITDIRFRIANILDVPKNTNVELVVVGLQDGGGKVDVLEENQKFESGEGSEECAKQFFESCSENLVWQVIGEKSGMYEYYLRSEGYVVKTTGIDYIKHGKLHVVSGTHTLSLKINGKESFSEIKSSKAAPFDFDLSIRNYSDDPEVVNVKIVSKGKGWFAHFYQDQELKNSDEFKVTIEANSTKNFRLMLSPQLTADNRLERSVPTRFEAQVKIASAENAENADEVSAVAVIE